MSKRRVLFIASTGGHLKELMQLESMFDNYDFNLITEKTKSNMWLKDKYKTIDNLFDVLSNIDKKYVLNKDVDVQITINPSRF